MLLAVGPPEEAHAVPPQSASRVLLRQELRVRGSDGRGAVRRWHGDRTRSNTVARGLYLRHFPSIGLWTPDPLVFSAV